MIDGEQVFAKFARGRAAGTHNDGNGDSPSGTGLGLSISRQIVRQLGGSLELLNDTGGGACFCVSLPVNQ